MAATPFDIPGPGSSYAFDIYNDSSALRAAAPALPGGPCNYTDQSLPRCGCRRFWTRASLTSAVFQDNLTSNLAEICMCSHHACFHEDVQPAAAQAPQQQPAAAAAMGQENQKPTATREPLSPVQLPSFHVPGSLGSSLDFTLLDFQTSMPAPRMDGAVAYQVVEDVRAGQDSPMPDTYNNWADLARSQPAHANGGLPPLPTQCLMSPPPPPSTAASSQARYLRPFAGRGLHTLSGVAASRPDSRQDGNPELAQEPARLVPGAAVAGFAPEGAPSQDPSVARFDTSAYQKLADRVDTHEQRLDKIDTASFSPDAHEECHDKHEHTDLRVTELESRVEEVEKILNDNGSVVSSRRPGRHDAGADDATASVVSVSTNATVLPSNRAEVYTQLQQLQAQVTQLQAAAMPSYSKPWELEVVFLPFPLKGVWIESKEFPAQRRSIGSNVDDWTQMPNTVSRATPDPQSPKVQEWAGQGSDSNWLLPRAFAAGRVIDQRLRSRGLIKTVSVRGADARSVQLAIHSAFEDVLRISSNPDARSGYARDYPLAEFLGLRQAWVPLRKLHKDSRLRFLSPAEMATPALWDFTFLVSSVVMKATGVQRLYITQPEAYLQDHPLGYHAFEAGWTWQKLRLLSRVYPDSQSSTGDVPEADALEECWNWNDRLDEQPGAPPPNMSLRHSIHQLASRRSSTEPSGQFYTGVQSPILSAGPSRSRAQSPLIQRERKGSWPPHIRTGSLPPTAAALLSPAQSRRRVNSHATASGTPYERRPSPFVPRASPRPSPRLGSNHHVHASNIPAAAAAAPKRRFTRSPSLIPRNTPRWSRSPSLAPGGPYGGFHDAEPARDQRRTTPFYYATPHSEAIPEFAYNRAGSRGPAALRTNGYDPDDEEDDDEDMNEFTEGSSDTDPYGGDSQMTDPHLQQQRQRDTASFGFGPEGDEADLDIDVYQDEQETDELDGVETDAGNMPHHHHHPHQFNHPAHARTASWQFHSRHRSSSLQHHHHHQQQPLRPEDIPWAGIEDITAAGAGAAALAAATDAEGDSNMSDGENVDPTSQSSLSASLSSRSFHSQRGGGVGISVHDHGAGQAHLQREEDAEDDDASSQAPSEYSSKPPGAWQIVPFPGATAAAAGGSSSSTAGEENKGGIVVVHGGQVEEGEGMGFRIHEDGTAGAGGQGEELEDTQWG